MSLPRKFWMVTRYARAARFWLLLALAALAWLGVGEANASNHGTREQALAHCMAELSRAQLGQQHPSLGYTTSPRCDLETYWDYTTYSNRGRYVASCTVYNYNGTIRDPGGACDVPAPPQIDRFHTWDTECPAGMEWNESIRECAPPCSARPEKVRPIIGGAVVRTGQTVCDNGCRAVEWSNGDGTATRNFSMDPGQCNATEQCSAAQTSLGWSWSYSANACRPPPEDCPPNQVKDPRSGECSAACQAGQRQNAMGECEPDGEKCPVGMTKAPDGSCAGNQEPNKCPAGQTKGPDGTCKPDENGDGEPDGEEGGEGEGTGNSFSGGDNCDVPPSCSGDAIMCGQARIQWRTECNTRKDTKISGGTCAAVPICAGRNCNAIEYAQLLQDWRSACLLEELVQKGGTGSGDPGEGTSVSYDASGEGIAVVDAVAGEGDPGDAFSDGSEGGDGDGELNTAGFGYGSGCPNLPSINVLGTTIDFNSVAGDMCAWFALAGQIVLILAALLSLRILAGGMNV